MRARLLGFTLAGYALGVVCGVAGCSGSSSSDSTSQGAAPGDAGSSAIAGSGGAAGSAISAGASNGAATSSAGSNAGGAGSSAAGTSSNGGAGAAAGGTSGAAGSSGAAAAGAGGSAGGAVTLDQTGNPIRDLTTTYMTWLSASGDAAAKLAADRTLADDMITWQMPHGGFDKNARAVYNARWNGTAPRSAWRGANDVEIGTIDNDATVTELLFLADVYRRSNVAAYRDAARRALDFLLTMQYPSGGLPQVYPARVGADYSNYVTFNDDAMIRVLSLLAKAAKLEPPVDGEVFTAEQRGRLPGAIARGVEFILRSQIAQGGAKTVWCAQHDPVSFAPREARSYELPSKSGKESAGVVAFLMTQPQTPEIKAAVQAALAWYRSSAVQVENTAYVSRPAGSTDDNYNPIQPRSGSTMWYRFYDLNQDVGFFSGRLPTDNPPGAGKRYDIMQIEPERRYGYEWGGGYGNALLSYAAAVGY